MVSDTEIKREVREFYDRVGWQEASDGFYQNASYEDLRPVSHEYIHKCHLRVARHLHPTGYYFLDAGSGPIQYPEYLEYSRGYRYRVCADLSMVALQEARKRIGAHGLFVVSDIAHLPFKSGLFDSAVSLHTIHHLPPEDHLLAYQELHRTLAESGKSVVVNSWVNPPLNIFTKFWVNVIKRLRSSSAITVSSPSQPLSSDSEVRTKARGTYIRKHDVAWLQTEVGSRMPINIWCWRSVSVTFLRTFIHPRLGGKWLLRLIYGLEELFPHFLGKYGQYPLVVMSK